jgi:hypothetical protein
LDDLEEVLGLPQQVVGLPRGDPAASLDRRPAAR